MNPAHRPILLLLPQQAKVLVNLCHAIKFDFFPLTNPRYIPGFGGNIRSLPLKPSTPTPPSHPKPRRDLALQRGLSVGRFPFFWWMLCLLMGLPGRFEIKMAGKGVVEVLVCQSALKSFQWRASKSFQLMSRVIGWESLSYAV